MQTPLGNPQAASSAPATAQPAGSGLAVATSGLRAYSLLAAIFIVWMIFAYTTEGIFLQPRNISNLMRQTAVTAILAVGMVMVIVARHIDLSVGSLVGLAGAAAAIAQTTYQLGLLPSLLIALWVGIGVGLAQGALVAYIGIPAFIVTLGGLLAWRGVVKGITQGSTIPVAIAEFKAIGQDYLPPIAGWILAAAAVLAIVWLAVRRDRARRQYGLAPAPAAATAARVLVSAGVVVGFAAVLNSYAGIPVPVMLFLGVAAAGAFIMRHTVFGRHVYALGGNPEAARLSGIDLERHVLAVFGIMGLLAGLAGIIYTARVGSASPDAGLLLELDAIAACVIGGASLLGGRGSVLGACLGALFMASLDNGMSLENISDFMQDIVKGTILVAAVGLDMVGRRRNN